MDLEDMFMGLSSLNLLKMYKNLKIKAVPF